MIFIRQMKWLTILLISFFTLGKALGQSTTIPTYFDLKSILPTSPDAALLGRFGEIPIGYYTGTADISIPIYTIEDKEAHFSLPISIRYHGSGIKVEDQASVVGLGWALEAEGAIIQIVNGREDTLDNMISISPPGYTMLQSGQVLGSYSIRPSIGENMWSCLESGYSGDSLVTMNLALQGDGQPDLYQYNFAGYSGKFYVNPLTHQVVMLDPKVQITFSRTGVHTWMAQTLDGNIFYFNTQENSYSSTIGNYAGYTSKLSSVQLNDGKVINFGYTQGYYSWFIYNETYHDGYPFGLNPVTEYGVTPHIAPTFNYVKYLTSITANNVTIHLNLQGRGDLGSVGGTDPTNSGGTANCIKSIDIIDPISNKLIKTFAFNYSYFSYSTIGGNFGSFLGGASGPELDTLGKRLRLDSVQEIGYSSSGSTITKPPYKFIYDTTNTLPLKTSLARDFWGYYNGEDNSWLTPDLTFLHGALYPGYTNLSATLLQTVQGGNRAPDRIKMTTDLLKQVTYPTGGYSVFNYEPNSFTNYMYPDLTKIADGTFQGFISDNNIATDVTASPHLSFPRTTLIHLNNTIARGVNQSVTFDALQPSYIQLVKITPGPTVQIVQTWQMMDTQPYTDTFAISNSYNWQTDVVLPYDSGAYYVINVSLPDNLGPQASPDNNSTVTCAYTYYSLPDSDTEVSYGGGVRLASIQNYDHNGAIISNKVLSYVNADSSSSGILMSPLNYVDNRQMTFVKFLSYTDGNLSWQNGSDSIEFMTSESSVPYSDAAQGSPVGYSRVEETDLAPDGSTNGRHVYYYHNVQSNTMINNPDDPDLLNGSITEEQILNAGGDGLVEKTYTYQENYMAHGQLLPVFNGIKTIPEFYGDGPCVFLNNGGQPLSWNTVVYVYVNYYPLNTKWYVPKSKTTNYYYGANSLSTTENYTYNMLGQLIETDSYNSKNQPVSTQYKYPNDTTGSQASLLEASGLLDNVMEEREWVNNALISETDILYGIQGGQTVRDSIVRTLNGGPSFTDVNFNQYGSYKTILQYTQRNSLSSVIWDYRNELPIAQVKNAAQSDIAYTSFEADGSGNWTIPDTTRNRTAGGITGSLSYKLTGTNSITKSGLNGATTYVVGFWVDSAGAVSINGSTTLATTKITLGTWIYKEAIVTGSTTVTIGGSGVTIDELRLYPKGSLMSTYTYAPLIGITSACDPSSRLTYYTYDGLGRLKLIKDQYGNILKRYDYEYQTTNQ